MISAIRTFVKFTVGGAVWAACTTNAMCTSNLCVQSTCGGDNKGFVSVYCK